MTNTPAQVPAVAGVGSAMQAAAADTFCLALKGKVRDSWLIGANLRAMVTSDRVSAFDRVLGCIAGKGAVLNALSLWWFERLADIVPHHAVALPEPNILLVRQAQPLPIEVVVRGYIAGSTNTALWTMYASGARHLYGMDFPDGLHKNDPLPQPVITPTSKAAAGAHDEPLSSAAVVQRGLVGPALWQQVQDTALALFARGQQIAAAAGLLLVDSKYEFGLINGQLTLIDEVHTPDSSRYWLASSYAHTPQAPQALDKEILRVWLRQQGYRGEGPPPTLTADIIAQMQTAYHTVANMLMGASAYQAAGLATIRAAPDEATSLRRLAAIQQQWSGGQL